MRAGYYLMLVRDRFRAQLSEASEYKADSLIGLVTIPVILLVNLLFWNAIFSRVGNIAGWTLADVILLQAYAFLGFTLWGVFFDFPDEIDSLVLSGDLNSVLVRPVNPLVYLWVTNMRPLASFEDLPRAAAYFVAAAWLGASITLHGFLISLFFLLVGVMTISALLLFLQSFSFWLGRVQLLSLFYNLFFSVYDYPVTIFPVIVKFVLVLFLPLFFFGTFPALASLNNYTLAQLTEAFTVALLVFFFWALAAYTVWTAGLRRYEAHGG